MQPDSVYGPMSQTTSQHFRTTPSQHYSNTVPEDERSVPTATNKVQVWKEVMVGTTGGQKFASLEKIIVPLESVQRDESKYMLFVANFGQILTFLRHLIWLNFIWQPRPLSGGLERGRRPSLCGLLQPNTLLTASGHGHWSLAQAAQTPSARVVPRAGTSIGMLFTTECQFVEVPVAVNANSFSQNGNAFG